MTAENILAEIDQVLASMRVPDCRSRETFLLSLTYLYHTMRASEFLLVCAGKLEKDEKLKEFFLRHREEERGHDKWLMEDLATAGVDVALTPVPMHASLTCGLVYYTVFHQDPAGLLGYMLLMEGRPVPLPVVSALEKLHGVEVCGTLRYHAEHDVGHREELKAIVDSLPEHRQRVLRETALSTAQLYNFGMSLIATRN